MTGGACFRTGSELHPLLVAFHCRYMLNNVRPDVTTRVVTKRRAENENGLNWNTPFCFFPPPLLHPSSLPSRQHLFIMKHTVGRRPHLAPPPRYLLQRLPPAGRVCSTSSAPPRDLLSLLLLLLPATLSSSRCHWSGKWVTTALNQSQVTHGSGADDIRHFRVWSVCRFWSLIGPMLMVSKPKLNRPVKIQMKLSNLFKMIRSKTLYFLIDWIFDVEMLVIPVAVSVTSRLKSVDFWMGFGGTQMINIVILKSCNGFVTEIQSSENKVSVAFSINLGLFNLLISVTLWTMVLYLKLIILGQCVDHDAQYMYNIPIWCFTEAIKSLGFEYSANN